MYDVLPDGEPAPGLGLALSTPHNYVARELGDLDTMILAVERAIAERRFGLDAVVSELDRQEPPELDLERPVETNFAAWRAALEEDDQHRSETADFYTALQTLRTLWRHGYEVDRHWPPGAALQPVAIVSVDPTAARFVADPWARSLEPDRRRPCYMLYEGSAAAKLAYAEAFGAATLPEMTARWFAGLFIADGWGIATDDLDALAASIVTGAREQARFARSTRHPGLPVRLEAAVIEPHEKIAILLPDLGAVDVASFDALIDVFRPGAASAGGSSAIGERVADAFLQRIADRLAPAHDVETLRATLPDVLQAAGEHVSLFGWPHDGFRSIEANAEELHRLLALKFGETPCDIVLIGAGRGGLVARALIQRLHDVGDVEMTRRIKGVTTLGAPHDGAAIARDDLGSAAAPFLSVAATANCGWSAVQAMAYVAASGRGLAEDLVGVADLRSPKDAPEGCLAALSQREASRATPPDTPFAAVGGDASSAEPDIVRRRAGPASAVQTAAHIARMRRIGPLGRLLTAAAGPLRRNRRRGRLARLAHAALRPLMIWCWRAATRRTRGAIGGDKRHDLLIGLPSTTWRAHPDGWPVTSTTVDRHHFGYLEIGDFDHGASTLRNEAQTADRPDAASSPPILATLTAFDRLGLVPAIIEYAAEPQPEPAQSGAASAARRGERPPPRDARPATPDVPPAEMDYPPPRRRSAS